MTSEILIMTNDSIVMGADSAVTINNRKTHNGANKLFKLSNKPPMGIMVFGAANFGSIALETIIKNYRNQTNFEKLEDISKIKESFIDYLNNIPYENTDFENKLTFFKEDLLNRMDYKSPKNVAKVLNCYKNIQILPFLENNPFIDTEFEDLIKKLGNDDIDINILKKSFSALLLNSSSGIIIAGFNENDFLPSVISFNLIAKYDNEIIISNVNSYINHDGNLIIPFAQNDVAETFISGFDNEFKNFLKYSINNYTDIYLNELIESLIENECIDVNCFNNMLENIQKLNKNNIEEFMQSIENFKEKNCNFISNSIGNVSIDVLVTMAETLILFTSLKRKFDSDLDSVGGDIDIIIITKGDGLIYKSKIDYTKK